MNRKTWSMLVALAVAILLPSAALAAKLPGSTPAWANASNYAGAAKADDAVGFRVYLGWQNASAAEALARAVSDPADQKKGSLHGFANPLFYANAGAFYDVLSTKTAVARRNFVNGVDASDGTADLLRTFDDYTGSPTQHTGPGWDNVTGFGTPSALFLDAISP